MLALGGTYVVKDWTLGASQVGYCGEKRRSKSLRGAFRKCVTPYANRELGRGYLYSADGAQSYLCIVAGGQGL